METRTLLSLLERANLNHLTQGAQHMKTESDPFSEKLCFVVT
jgi:hypothetical protein